jgi:uncharacterized membrane protein YhaH (DUF805 family)
VSPVAAVQTCLSKYLVLKGRATRSEYWWYIAFQLTSLVAFLALEEVLGIGPAGRVLWLLLTFIPGITAAVRRLHDTGRSGGWYFISYVPFIGWLWMLVLMLMPSDRDNEYGPNPKAAAQVQAQAQYQL